MPVLKAQLALRKGSPGRFLLARTFKDNDYIDVDEFDSAEGAVMYLGLDPKVVSDCGISSWSYSVFDDQGVEVWKLS